MIWGRVLYLHVVAGKDQYQRVAYQDKKLLMRDHIDLVDLKEVAVKKMMVRYFYEIIENIWKQRCRNSSICSENGNSNIEVWLFLKLKSEFVNINLDFRIFVVRINQ